MPPDADLNVTAWTVTQSLLLFFCVHAASSFIVICVFSPKILRVVDSFLGTAVLAIVPAAVTNALIFASWYLFSASFFPLPMLIWFAVFFALATLVFNADFWPDSILLAIITYVGQTIASFASTIAIYKYVGIIS